MLSEQMYPVQLQRCGYGMKSPGETLMTTELSTPSSAHRHLQISEPQMHFLVGQPSSGYPQCVDRVIPPPPTRASTSPKGGISISDDSGANQSRDSRCGAGGHHISSSSTIRGHREENDKGKSKKKWKGADLAWDTSRTMQEDLANTSQ